MENRIKQLLNEKGMKPMDLAYHLQVSEATVRNWAANRTQPTWVQLDTIAKILNVSPKKLKS